jgi:hypothetical protein
MGWVESNFAKVKTTFVILVVKKVEILYTQRPPPQFTVCFY